jgi:hypothetical protein
VPIPARAGSQADKFQVPNTKFQINTKSECRNTNHPELRRRVSLPNDYSKFQISNSNYQINTKSEYRNAKQYQNIKYKLTGSSQLFYVSTGMAAMGM